MTDPRETFMADQAEAADQAKTRDDLVFQAQLRNTTAHAVLEEAWACRRAQEARVLQAVASILQGPVAMYALILVVRAVVRSVRR